MLTKLVTISKPFFIAIQVYQSHKRHIKKQVEEASNLILAEGNSHSQRILKKFISGKCFVSEILMTFYAMFFINSSLKRNKI